MTGDPSTPKATTKASLKASLSNPLTPVRREKARVVQSSDASLPKEKTKASDMAKLHHQLFQESLSRLARALQPRAEAEPQQEFQAKAPRAEASPQGQLEE